MDASISPAIRTSAYKKSSAGCLRKTRLRAFQSCLNDGLGPQKLCSRVDPLLRQGRPLSRYIISKTEQKCWDHASHEPQWWLPEPYAHGNLLCFFEKGCCTVSCSKSVIKTRLLSLNISTSSIIGIDTNLGSGTKHRNRRTTMWLGKWQLSINHQYVRLRSKSFRYDQNCQFDTMQGDVLRFLFIALMMASNFVSDWKCII